MADVKNTPPFEISNQLSHKHVAIRIGKKNNTVTKAINSLTKVIKEEYKGVKVKEGDIIRLDIMHLR